MLKAKIIGLIALCLITGLMLVACGGEATPAPANAPAAVATATPAPTKAASSAQATDLGTADANALYAGLQKTYQTKSLKVNGQLIQEDKKFSQNFEIVPGDRLHGTTVAPDGKSQETIIIGNSRFDKAAGVTAWSKPQTPGSGDLRKEMNSLGLIDPAQMLDQVKTKGATVQKMPNVTENGETLTAYTVEFQSQYIPDGLAYGSEVTYYFDKNNMVKRVMILNIGSRADYTYTDYNTSLNIVAP